MQNPLVCARSSAPLWLHGMLCSSGPLWLHGMLCSSAALWLHGMLCSSAPLWLHGMLCSSAPLWLHGMLYNSAPLWLHGMLCSSALYGESGALSVAARSEGRRHLMANVISIMCGCCQFLLCLFLAWDTNVCFPPLLLVFTPVLLWCAHQALRRGGAPGFEFFG